MNNMLLLFGSGLVTVQVAAALGVLFRIVVAYPQNYWPLDIRWGWIVSVVALVVAAVGIKRQVNPKLCFLICGVLAIVGAVAVLFLDQLNILVETQRWVARGRPPFGAW